MNLLISFLDFFFRIAFYSLLGSVVFSVCYYWIFALIFLFGKKRDIPDTKPAKKFVILIPAHNEEQMISETLDSVSHVNYPKELFDIVVIADNCTDKTVDIVSVRNIQCLSRRDEFHKGKGYALNWASKKIDLNRYDALVVIDADTSIKRDFLTQMNNCLCSGLQIIQAYNTVRDYNRNSLTRLMYITSVLTNTLFNEAKSKVGLSVSLLGTGMCFDTKILKIFPWEAFSVGEDREYYSQLLLQGYRVYFCPQAFVFAQEAASLVSGWDQRVRWANSKFDVMWNYGFPILLKGLKNLDLYLIDGALTLIAPNYSLLVNLNLLIIVLAILPFPGLISFLPLALVLLLAQILYFIVGLIVAHASMAMICSVFLSPIFLFWKLSIDILALFGYKRKNWIRTDRELSDV